MKRVGPVKEEEGGGEGITSSIHHQQDKSVSAPEPAPGVAAPPTD